MFARYNYSAGATLANIKADIVAILTGTTDKATLSASCDQANTYIYNTYTNAEWILHDNAAGTNKVVLKGARFDDPTSYEYLMLDFYSVEDGLVINLYETWNSTSHIGTNASIHFGASDYAYFQRIAPTAGGSMIIYANKGRCALFQCNTASGIGDDTYKAWLGCFQRSRKSPWDTVAAGYPISHICCGYMFGAPMFLPHCRGKNASGADYTGTNALTSISWYGNRYATYPITSTTGGQHSAVFKIPDGAGGYYAPLTNIGTDRCHYGNLGGSFSDVCDIWLGISYPFNLDEVVTGGKTYVFLQNTSASQATSYGTANICVPKG